MLCGPRQVPPALAAGVSCRGSLIGLFRPPPTSQSPSSFSPSRANLVIWEEDLGVPRCRFPLWTQENKRTGLPRKSARLRRCKYHLGVWLLHACLSLRLTALGQPRTDSFQSRRQVGHLRALLGTTTSFPRGPFFLLILPFQVACAGSGPGPSFLLPLDLPTPNTFGSC